MHADAPRGCWAGYARELITRHLGGEAQGAAPSPGPLGPHGGVFVTLHKLGGLRGCMGTLDADLPLADAVREAALSACEHDPRFPRVELGELPDIRIEVSILSAPQPLTSLDELELGRHGVLVRRGNARGLFLPQVAIEHALDREAFLGQCCADKAGLPPDAWRAPGTEVLVFTTSVYSE